MDLFVELKAIISDFQAKMVEARGEMEETEKKGGSSFAGLGSAATLGLAAVATTAVAAGGVMLDLAVKFQDSTAKMAAAGNIPIKTAEQIGQAFLHTSSDTVYSGVQMEAAYGGVAAQLSTLKGYTDTATTASRFMSAAMDLAEESGSSLGSATSDLAKVMQAYGLNIAQAVPASVDLFNTSRLTGQSMDSLTQAMTRLHAQLGIATPSIGDASALLLDLSEHGESGRPAMSALGSAFTGIVAPTAKVTAAQKAMGLSFINSKGQLLPMRDIIAELGPKIDGMGSAQAAATLKALGFGSASLKLVATIQAGPKAFDAAAQAVNNTAAAHAALAVQQKTLGHELDAIKVQFENVATSIGLKLLPYVQDALKDFSGLINWLEGHKTVMEAIGVTIGVVLVAALASFTAGLVATAVAWALTPFGAITLGLMAVAAAAVYLATHWHQVWSDIKAVAADVWHFLDGVWQAIVAGVVTAWDFIKAHLGIIIPIIASIILGPIGLLVALIATHWSTIKADVIAVWDAIKTFLQALWKDIEADAKTAWNAISTAVTAIWHALDTAIRTVWNGLRDFLKAEWAGFSSTAKTLWNAVSTAITNIWHALDTLIRAIWTALREFLKSEWNAFVNTGRTLWNGITGAISVVWHTLDTGVRATWTNLKAFFTSEWTGWKTTVKGMWDGIVGVITNSWSALTTGATTLWDNIKAGFITGINDVVNGINTIFIDPINDALSIIDLKIPDIPTVGAAQGARIGPGGVTDGPMVLVGEGRRQYPEYVIPTDPQHRANAHKLTSQLSADIGHHQIGLSGGGTVGGGSPNLGAGKGGGQGIKFSGGTDIGSVVGAIGGLAGDVVSAIKSGLASAIMASINAIAGPLEGVLGAIPPKMVGDAASGTLKAAVTDIGKYIAGHPYKAPAAAGGAAGPVNTSFAANQRLGQSMAAAVGWTGPEWLALNSVEMDEAGWNPTAQNPHSSAYGIAQFINGPGEYASYGGNSGTVAGQITAMITYIKQRYGDPIRALAHENSMHWYDQGGILPPGVTMAMNNTGRNEYVSRTPPSGAGGVTVQVTIEGNVFNWDQTAQQLAEPVRKALLVGAGRNATRIL